MARAILIYRRTCAKCRVLSIVALACGLGTLRRVPHDGDEVAALGHPCFDSDTLKLTLVCRSVRLRGVAAVLAIPFIPIALATAPIAMALRAGRRTRSANRTAVF